MEYSIYGGYPLLVFCDCLFSLYENYSNTESGYCHCKYNGKYLHIIGGIGHAVGVAAYHTELDIIYINLLAVCKAVCNKSYLEGAGGSNETNGYGFPYAVFGCGCVDYLAFVDIHMNIGINAVGAEYLVLKNVGLACGKRQRSFAAFACDSIEDTCIVDIGAVALAGCLETCAAVIANAFFSFPSAAVPVGTVPPVLHVIGIFEIAAYQLIEA